MEETKVSLETITSFTDQFDYDNQSDNDDKDDGIPKDLLKVKVQDNP